MPEKKLFVQIGQDFKGIENGMAVFRNTMREATEQDVIEWLEQDENLPEFIATLDKCPELMLKMGWVKADKLLICLNCKWNIRGSKELNSFCSVLGETTVRRYCEHFTQGESIQKGSGKHEYNIWEGLEELRQNHKNKSGKQAEEVGK
jgi:hypothetical protein